MIPFKLFNNIYTQFILLEEENSIQYFLYDPSQTFVFYNLNFLNLDQNVIYLLYIQALTSALNVLCLSYSQAFNSALNVLCPVTLAN